MDALAEVADLAPGDGRACGFDWTGLRVTRVQEPTSPLFERVVARLLEEFGARGELERREVLAARLGWRPEQPIGGWARRYEMMVVERAGEIVAMRDHTAMVGDAGDAIVHLSHVLVEPAWRGSGLAAWLRALPLVTARECAAAASRAGRAITLVAEMEAASLGPAATRRLRSYERAGFRKIDPERVAYAQPDFRAPAEIDATGVRPLPLTLVVRRVGRESEERMSGAEVRGIVRALYAMFGEHARASDMAPLRRIVEDLPRDDETVDLFPPTR